MQRKNCKKNHEFEDSEFAKTIHELTIFSASITIYSQQLHLNLIYINMYQDGINYSQIHLYQNTSNMRPILYISMWTGGGRG